MDESRAYDVLVVGGGATGAGVLRDLARRGLRALLVERGDYGTGTTGRYHGLLHSGGRYVAKDALAARECIAENRILRRIAPASIEDTGGYFVATPDDPDDYVDGFQAACVAADVDCEEVPLAEAFRREPALNPGIRRVFKVPDGSVEPWQLIESNIADARAHGSDAWSYQRLVGMERDGGRIVAATLRDERSGSLTRVTPRFVVSCAGAWAGQIAAMANVTVTMHPGKGTMLIFNQRMTDTVVNRCHKSSDGDIMVPVHTVAILGTTEQRVDDPDQYEITRDEVSALLREGEKLFPDLSRMRLLRAYAGVRPLYQPPAEVTAAALSDGRQISRAHTVIDHAALDGVENFVTIVGGKLTTFRAMAQDTVDMVCGKLGVTEPCTTADEILPGQVPGEDVLAGPPAGRPRGGGRRRRRPPVRVRARHAADAGGVPRPPPGLLAGRCPARHANWDGALPGWLLHVPRGGRGGRAGRAGRGPRRRRAGGPGHPRVPAGALQGNPADRCRPAAPGAVDDLRRIRWGPGGRVADRARDAGRVRGGRRCPALTSSSSGRASPG